MKVLAVIDMQNDFVSGALGTKEAQAIVPAVTDMVKTFEGTVLYTMDTHGEDYMTTQEGRHLPVPHCLKGTWGWELVDELKVLCEEAEAPVFEKPSFGSEDFAQALVELDEQSPIEEIVFVGLCTDICVISNAMLAKAALPEVPIRIVASACAGVTPESHENALAAMKMCQMEID